MKETIKDAVTNWIETKKEDEYTEETILSELSQNGCVSGMVGGLIYYHDTLRFYKDHEEEVNALLYDAMEVAGCSIDELFGDKWNAEDPLAIQTNNQNLLAWFAFEETARSYADEKEYNL